MTKLLALLTISIILLTSTTGCTPVKPEPVKPEPVKPEPVKPEPVKPEPVKPEPVKPPRLEPQKTEPAKPEPPEAEPQKTEPQKPEPLEVKPPKTEPPKAKPAKPQPAKPETPPVVSFHDKCADILKNYVNNDGTVDYKNLKRKRPQLRQLLDEFDKLDPNQYNSWPEKDKIAFWINAYNIKMLDIIVDNYPIKSSRIHRLFWHPNSIRNIKGIWSNYKFIVMNEQFTLSEVDRRFFRSQFDDPRIFFAISHASLSSPPLHNEPYYGHKLDEQLNNQVRKFLSGPYGLRTARDSKIVYLSAILQPTWHGKEFISKYGTDKKFKDHDPTNRAILNFITNYISEQDVRFLEIENYSIKYIKYDWRLNEYAGCEQQTNYES